MSQTVKNKTLRCLIEIIKVYKMGGVERPDMAQNIMLDGYFCCLCFIFLYYLVYFSRSALVL